MSEDPAPGRLERLRDRAIGVIEAGVARGDPAMVREAIRLTHSDLLDVVGLVEAVETVADVERASTSLATAMMNGEISPAAARGAIGTLRATGDLLVADRLSEMEAQLKELEERSRVGLKKMPSELLPVWAGRAEREKEEAAEAEILHRTKQMPGDD
jgi:hypothetical protein